MFRGAVFSGHGVENHKQFSDYW